MARTGPFPGMDPWVENPWGGMHHALIGFIQDQLNEQLPRDLIARVDERIFIGRRIEEGDVEVQIRLPDVYVVERPELAGAQRSSATAILDEPVVIRFQEEPVTEGYIEIVDATDQSKVYTAIEVLSATNKLRSDGREEYEAKREEYHRGGVSTVEIDLLRQGKHLVALPYNFVPPQLRSTYCVCVRRG